MIAVMHCLFDLVSHPVGHPSSSFLSGKTFEESKRKILDEFSKATMSNRSVVFILHGHGTGVLKQKIRSWLSNNRQWVKSYGPAEQVDGGEALTKVILKKQSLF